MSPGSVFPIQIGLVAIGTCGSIGLMQAISFRDYPANAGRASMPWILVLLLFAAAAFWIFGQPMDMRGLSSIG